MKALPGKLFVGAALLAALTLPASAAKKNNGGLNDKSLGSGSLMQKSHKKSQAEKDARRTEREIKQDDAEDKRRAELLKKFDVNHDGVLDDAEKATMEAALKKAKEKRDQK